jgi:hypothetical protein
MPRRFHRPGAQVEDDCENIGGTAQTCAAQLRPAARQSVQSVVLPEFSGLADLLANPAGLLTPGGTPAGQGNDDANPASG